MKENCWKYYRIIQDNKRACDNKVQAILSILSKYYVSSIGGLVIKTAQPIVKKNG